MAGEVTGMIGNNDVVLENAATEATLELLLQATLANGKDKKAADKIQKAYEESLKNSTKGNIANLRAIREEEAARDNLNKQLEEEKKRRTNMLELLEGLGNTIGKGVNVAFATSVPKINDFTNALSGIPIIGPVIGAFGNALQGSIDSFRELSNVGANLGTNINDVRNAAADARLSLDGFKKIVMSNSVELALLEGSTNGGVQTFTRLSNQLQRNVQPRLANLGIGLEETSEYLAGYLTIQTRLGRAQSMTDGQLIAGTENYILQLDRLARITGISRKEAEETLKRQTMDKQFRAMLATMSPQVAGEFQTLIATLEKTSPDLAEAAKEFAVSGGVPITETGKRIALFNGEFGKTIASFARGQGSFQDVIGSIQRGATQANSVSKEFARVGTIASLSGNDIALGFTAFQGLENLGKQFSKATLDQKRDLENLNNAVLDAERKLLNVRNAIMLALEPALDIFGLAISNSAGIIDPDSEFMQNLKLFFISIAEGTKEFIDIMSQKGLGAALANAMQGVGEFLGPILADILKSMFVSLFTSPIVIGGLVAAIAALYAKQAVVNAIKDAKTSGTPLVQAPRQRGLLRGVGLGAVAGIGTGMLADAVGTDTKAGAGLDVAGSAISGAATGALLGSFVPVIGTAIGGALGGVLGAGMGLFNNSKTLFGGDKSKAPAAANTANDPALQTAAQVAAITTEAEVRGLAKALKELDYNRLTVPESAIASIEIGTNKIKTLRSEVDSMTTSFRSLNNTGLEKITRGIERLSDEFKDFNRSFVDDFMSKFTNLDKKSQETLLSELNDKADQLNMHMSRLVTIQSDLVPYARNTARNTKSTIGNIIP